MNENPYATMINLACGAAAVTVLVPYLVYLFTGWRVRRDKLLSYMKPDALEIYFEQFPWTKFEKEHNQTRRFKRQFDFLYGRRHYIAPTMLLVFVGGAGAVITARLANAWIAAPSATSTPRIAIAASALLGGFLWSISDELGRIRRRDIAPGDVYVWSLRLLVSVPFGFAVAAVLKEDAGVPVAFFLGAFPTKTLFTIARRLASQKGLGEQQSDPTLELENLQSVSRTNAEQYQDAGISTIAALAWADPIDLTIRTNFDLNYVLDCMSQALFWVYLENDRAKAKSLYALSLRGAQEVAELVKSLPKTQIPVAGGPALTRKQATALTTLNEAARVLGISEAALLTTLCQVSEDPYTKFIREVWH
jgi:hypothetical protein